MTSERFDYEDMALPDQPPESKSRLVASSNLARHPILLEPGTLHEAATLAEKCLAGHSDVYQRAHQLVHIVEGNEVESNTPTVKPLRRGLLSRYLSQVASLVKPSTRSNSGVIPTNPPDAFMSMIDEADGWPSIRPLRGLLEAPSFREDGSILQSPGYDPQTGFYYRPGIEFEWLPDNPTQTDASEAYETLRDLFCDFPFTSEAARTVPICALLTLLARPALKCSVPAFVIDASTRGSGKTRVCDLVSLITRGRPTAKLSFPPHEEELEKILSSSAMAASQLLNFDNVSVPFGGGPIDKFLTCGTEIEMRVLGKSELKTFTWNGTIVANGNNIALIGDTTRRVLIGRMEPRVERPEDLCKFKYPDVEGWALANRANLVQAGLTILRAWHVAGRPAIQAWGSFEKWSGVVPSALVFAGAPNPLACRGEDVVESHDSEREAFGVFLRDFPRLSVEGCTLSRALKALYPGGQAPKDCAPDGFEDLRDAVESMAGNSQPGRMPSPQKLACSLRKYRDRIQGGRKLSTKVDRTKSVVWQVVEVGCR